MTKDEASQFAMNSFILAFEPGNESMIDHYFSPNLYFHHHTLSKDFTLDQLKLSAQKVQQKYQNLKSVLKDVIVDGDQIAFRVEQTAFYIPHEENINMDVMNIYTLSDGQVKLWRLWDHGYIKPISEKESLHNS